MRIIYILVIILLNAAICNSDEIWNYTKKSDINLTTQPQIQFMEVSNSEVIFKNNSSSGLFLKSEIFTFSSNGELLSMLSPKNLQFSRFINWKKFSNKNRFYYNIDPFVGQSQYGYCDFDLEGNQIDSVFFLNQDENKTFIRFHDFRDEEVLIVYYDKLKGILYLSYNDLELIEKSRIDFEPLSDTLVFDNLNLIKYDPITDTYLKLHYDNPINSSLYATYSVISKHDNKGRFLWSTKVQNQNYDSTQVRNLKLFDDGSYLVLGRLLKYKTEDNFIMKYDKDNNLILNQIIPENKISNNSVSSRYFKKEFYYEAGEKIALDFKSSSFSIQKKDYEGNVIYEKIWGLGRINVISAIYPLENNEIYVGGRVGNDTLYFAKIKLGTTSINEQYLPENMIIQPNPASDFITIQFSNKELQPFAAGDKVQIFDMLGIEVMSVGIGLDLSSQRIDVSHLPAGVYFIRIGSRVEKFVKM
jgi:hypothetical protein